MIRRRWVATCDDLDCTALQVLEGDQYDGKWALGEQVSDEGWQASPGVDETYCPEHHQPVHDEGAAGCTNAPDCTAAVHVVACPSKTRRAEAEHP